MEHDEAFKAEIIAAFRDALNRLRREHREPDAWEAHCLVNALTAMATGAYGLADEEIENCFWAPRYVREEFGAISSAVTIAGLESSLTAVLTLGKACRM